MITVHSIAELRQAVAAARAAGQRIGLVPTMGNLHAGHISLLRNARQRAGFVVASIFVNPLQFGPSEDLDKYPRTLAEDQRQLAEAGCDLLFAPNVEEMYPHGMDRQVKVVVPGVSEGLCGASRPGHFDGVSTVVCKLFNMVQPDVAVFGEKDFQQLAVIRAMVEELNMPIEIIGGRTVRADDGLALSSRNGYLEPAQRDLAPAFPAQLQALAEAIRGGRRDYPTLLAEGRAALQELGLHPDYLELREARGLRPAQPSDRDLVLLGAVYLGNTRLIDNLRVELI